jgi:hypothetical protein
MFDFLKKHTSIDDPQLTVAGIWAGIIFLQNQKRFGETPEFMVSKELADIIKIVVKQKQLRPNQDGVNGINAIAVTIAFDRSGLASRIFKRFESGDKSVAKDEVEEAIQLAKNNAISFAQRFG